MKSYSNDLPNDYKPRRRFYILATLLTIDVLVSTAAVYCVFGAVFSKGP